MTMKWLVVVGIGLMTPGMVFAQTASPTAETPRWTVAVGGAWMDPLHADEYEEGPVVMGAVGYALHRNLRVEGEVTWRTHTRTFVRNDVFLYGGPTGIHGRADRTELGNQTTDWTAGINLLGTARWRMLSVFAGPGVVLHREDDRTYYTVTNCTPPIPSNGFECGGYDKTTTDYGPGLQLMAGLDLNVHRRVTLYAAGRAEYRRDLSMGGVGAMGGLRVGW
jgi:hypothetical protein